MSADTPNVGAYVRGATPSPRVLCRHADLLTAYADGVMMDRNATGEAYLSHYAFGDDYRTHYEANGNGVAGFSGKCWCRWLVLDIDRDDLGEALADAGKLVAFLHRRYPDLEGVVPVYFSGSKGFHILLELAHRPPPTAGFHRTAKALAKALADRAGVRIDESVYDIAHIIRLPNTRHPMTGLYKRCMDADALFRLDSGGVRRHAANPAGDGIPSAKGVPGELVTDWADAEQEAVRAAAARAADRAASAGDRNARAPRYVFDFLRFGHGQSESRHHNLFRCSAWLAEQGAPPLLCFALLTEPGLDVGLPPKDVERQIRCGVEHANRQRRIVGPMFPPCSPIPLIDPAELEKWVRRAGWEWERIRDHIDRTGAYCPDAGTVADLSNPQRAELLVLALAATSEGGSA